MGTVKGQALAQCCSSEPSRQSSVPSHSRSCATQPSTLQGICPGSQCVGGKGLGVTLRPTGVPGVTEYGGRTVTAAIPGCRLLAPGGRVETVVTVCMDCSVLGMDNS